MAPFIASNPGIPNNPTGPNQFFSSDKIYTPAFQIPYYQQDRANLRRQGEAYKNRQFKSPYEGQQNDLFDLMSAQARGEGPSVAENALRQATDRNLSQMMAAGASQPGQANPAMQRSLLYQGGQMGQEAGMNASMLRAQEMQQARQSLAQALSEQRQQDMQFQQLNDQMVSFYTQQGLGLNAAQAAANMDLQKLQGQNYQQKLASDIQAAASTKSFFGSIFSDRRLKQDEINADHDIHEFLDSLEESDGL